MELQLKKGNMTAVVTDAGAELISLTDGRGMEYIWLLKQEQNWKIWNLFNFIQVMIIQILWKACVRR